MTKTQLIKILNDFPYNKEDYWVITGAAMVLYRIKETTIDIDLGCNSRLADVLQRDGLLCKYTEDGNRHFKFGEHIEIFENWLNDSTTIIENLHVISIKGLIEMKQQLGREKDFQDIHLINEYLAKGN